MYRKMLVLLDGSKLAEAALRYARELSARLGIDVELLNVCNPHEADQMMMRQAYMEQMAEKLNCQTAAVRARIGEAAAMPEIKARVKVLVGYPAEEILTYAHENNVDLVVFSSLGQSGIRVWDIGNVANKVIHASKVDILMVPTELKEEQISDRLPLKTLVVPLDGTRSSEVIIPHALDLAKQKGTESEIVLVHVDNPEKPLPGNIDREKYLANMVERVKREGIRARAELLKGDPASAIISYIEGHPADMVVMSTHAHRGLTTMVFSSVLESVLHMVKKAPILVVKPAE
jgi:nucleotide-binding universal stress UspA family protein